MQNFAISSDSTCDLSEALVKENNVTIFPITIILGDKEYKDGVDVTSEQVIKFVEDTGTMPKTAAHSVEDYKEYFEELLKTHDGVLHFCISAEDSSCYDHALLASKEFNNVYVVDSRNLSTGQGLLVLKAADFKSEGLDLKTTFDKVVELTVKTQTSFVLDRLDFLHKGGRCSLMALLGAKILKIHPHISMQDGALKVKKKYGGNMIRSVEQYVTDLATEYTQYDKTRAFVTHCLADRDIVEAVKAKVAELFEFDVVLETYAGSTVSSHCGKNTIGVLFINE